MGFFLYWYPQTVHFHYQGIVTNEDLLSSNLLVYGDPRFDELRWEIVSFEPNSVIKADPQTVKQIAYFDRGAYRTNPRISVILVVDLTIQQQIFDIYATHASPNGWEVITTSTLEKAFAQAGLSSVPREG